MESWLPTRWRTVAERIIRLGIIGTGLAARDLHWPALAALRDEFEVVALCNRSEGKARSLAETIGSAYGRKIPYVLDVESLLALPQVEAVAIVLPIEQNREVCEAAVRARKHILVEKPLAESLENAEALVELARGASPLVMMVAENFRYRPIFRALAETLRSGEIGEPYFVEWRHWDRIDPETNPYARTAWRIDHRYEGGFVTDGGVHDVAALRDVFGDLETLGAASRSVNPAIGRTDTLAWLFHSSGRDGIPPLDGVFSIGFSVIGMTDSRLVVLGSRGTVLVEGGRLEVQGEAPDDEKKVYRFPDDGGYVEEYRDFHRAITTGAAPRSSFAEACSDLAAILAALKTASRR
jgi:predicted dehydrogenase